MARFAMRTRRDAERELFGSVIFLTQSWMSLLDSILEPDGLSARQWMLLAVIESFGDDAPTLGQAANGYRASHQAVKNLAVRLEQKGLRRVPSGPRRSTLRPPPPHAPPRRVLVEPSGRPPEHASASSSRRWTRRRSRRRRRSSEPSSRPRTIEGRIRHDQSSRHPDERQSPAGRPRIGTSGQRGIGVAVAVDPDRRPRGDRGWRRRPRRRHLRRRHRELPCPGDLPGLHHAPRGGARGARPRVDGVPGRLRCPPDVARRRLLLRLHVCDRVVHGALQRPVPRLHDVARLLRVRLGRRLGFARDGPFGRAGSGPGGHAVRSLPSSASSSSRSCSCGCQTSFPRWSTG